MKLGDESSKSRMQNDQAKEFLINLPQCIGELNGEEYINLIDQIYNEFIQANPRFNSK